MVIYLYFSQKIDEKDNKYMIISTISCLSCLIILISGERTSIALFVLSILIFVFSSRYLRKIYFLLLLVMILFASTIATLDNRVKDYTSGFICMNKYVFDNVELNKTGFGEYFIEFCEHVRFSISSHMQFGHSPVSMLIWHPFGAMQIHSE